MDANVLACDTVIHSVGTSPQSGGKADYLIAHRALGHLHGDQYQPTIQALAKIDPDAERLAKKINKFHERFNIPRRVEPDKAKERVTNFAHSAVEKISKATVSTADEQNIEISDELRGDLYVMDWEADPHV